MAEQRTITKALGGVEDLLYGKGTVQQERAGNVYTVTKNRVIRPVDSLEELNALDPDQFPEAVLINETSLTNYLWNGAEWVIAGGNTDLNVFETLADAVATTNLKVDDYVTITGRTEFNDAGQANYVVVSAGTGTVDNGLFIALDNGLQLALLVKNTVSVEEFGAKAGLANDNTTPFYNALISEKNVKVGAGEFTMVGQSFRAFGQTLNGEDQYSTVLSANAASMSVFNTNDFSGNQLKNVRLDGRGFSNTTGLAVNNTYYSVFENVDIRNTTSNAVNFVNSNDNVFDCLQTHNTLGNGIVLDANSQHNTFNACGAEDFQGIGFRIQGIGNVLNAPWIENRDSATSGTDIGISINGRDNVMFGAEIRGGATNSISLGLELGAFSNGAFIVNPHFAHCTQDIKLYGTDQYRYLFGVTLDQVDNSNSDTTTLIQRGNEFYSDIHIKNDAPALNFESENGVSGIRIRVNGTASSNLYRFQYNNDTLLEINSDKHITPGTDNLQNLGSASLRYAIVYAGTGTINTSDERSKQQFTSIDDAEKAAALEIKQVIKKYKFNDSVEEKGDKARWHFGVGAQTVKSIMESHGLVAEDYGFLCFDKWDDKYEPVMKRVLDAPAVKDEHGHIIKEAEFHHEQIGEKLVLKAGEKYGIRYDELLAFIICAM